jgi:hypothetical protein
VGVIFYQCLYGKKVGVPAGSSVRNCCINWISRLEAINDRTIKARHVEFYMKIVSVSTDPAWNIMNILLMQNFELVLQFPCKAGTVLVDIMYKNRLLVWIIIKVLVSLCVGWESGTHIQ